MREEPITYTYGVMKVYGSIVVTDPSYEINPRLNLILNDMKEGEYAIEYKVGKFYKSKRVMSVKITMDNENSMENEWAGDVCVDSGTCGFYDLKEFEKLNKDDKKKDEWYDREVCEPIEDKVHLSDEGLWASSGFGDGQYPVYVTRDADTNEIDSVEIVFIEEDED